MTEPLLLSRRLAVNPELPGQGSGACEAALLVLALSAAERQRLRGHGVARVQVEAAAEELLRVRSDDPMTLLRAAYHLGNRHVALELGPGELRLLRDPVLSTLLHGLGVSVDTITVPFRPEGGAYGSNGHHHDHSHRHGHDH